MAKFGEGDDRWIVKDLGEQGTNVNNWHWKEYDAFEWSDEKLKSLLDGVTLVESPVLTLRITAVNIKGEAVINNRKNKLIPAYELDLDLKWEGKLLDGSGAEVASPKGSIKLPYLSDENHDEEPEVKFSGETEDSATQRIKEAFQSQGKHVITKAVAGFIKELRAGGPMLQVHEEGGMVQASSQQAVVKPKLSSAKTEDVKPKQQTSSDTSSRPLGGKSLTLSEKYYARPSDIFECFVVEGKMRAYTQTNVKLDPHPGGSFSWFNGSVVGEFLELEADKKIVMKWKFNTWKEECFSKVTITLDAPEVGTTILKLHQTDIPEEDAFGQPVFENTEKGWRGQILQRIRQVFGYGV
jgi:activator of HSP90 ATPase